MGSMDQRVPWNQFIREAKVGHSGSPTCDCCGMRRWTCYKKCTSALALSPQLLLVRRESGCTGVCRSDSLDKLMQEECAHFRVGAIWRGKRGPFLSFWIELMIVFLNWICIGVGSSNYYYYYYYYYYYFFSTISSVSSSSSFYYYYYCYRYYSFVFLMMTKIFFSLLS